MPARIIDEYRKALLAGTALTHPRPVKDNTSPKHFGKSAHIARRFGYVSEAELMLALERFAGLIGMPASEFAEIAKQKIHRFKLEEFSRDLIHLRSEAGEDPIAVELRKFFAGQIIFTILEDVRNEQKTYPPIVERVFREAAEGLFKFGCAQFVELACVADELVGWMQRAGLTKIAVVETPLGNCVPVGVLVRVAKARGLNIDVVEWAFPRNTTARGGYNVKRAAKTLALDPKISDAECVLLLDDVLTGSRLLNIAKEMQRAIGKERLAVVGLQFTYPRGSSRPPFKARDLTRFDEWAERLGMPFGNRKIPPLPLFKGDRGDNFYFESASAWCDSDLIAGKRKVNLLFNTIDFYEAIVRDLASPTGVHLHQLKGSIWARDESRAWAFGPGVVEETFRGIFSNLSIDRYFEDLRSHAQSSFESDYLGLGVDLSDDAMKRKVDWLSKAIETCATRQLPAGEAGILARAIIETNNAGLNKRSVPKDHAYGHYTSPYNATVRILNSHLCDRVADLATTHGLSK